MIFIADPKLQSRFKIENKTKQKINKGDAIYDYKCLLLRCDIEQSNAHVHKCSEAFSFPTSDAFINI